LPYVRIVASNDLDEYTIQSLHEQGARIDSWGVGTRLVTAWDQPALTGVYKLCATRVAGDSQWSPQLKISEQSSKSTLPGLLAARRYFDDAGMFVGDMVYDEQEPPQDHLIIDPADGLRRKTLAGFSSVELLEPFMRGGKVVGRRMDAFEAQKNTRDSLKRLHPTNKRLLNPHSYPVGLARPLLERRDHMLRQAHSLDR
jgi:nicotinate phosphoribosyltransferase